MLYIKKREPFVRQPSSESMARAGVPVAEFPMTSTVRRRSSADTTSSGLRPLSMASIRPITRADTESGVEPTRSKIRATLEDGALAAAGRAGQAWRWAEPRARELAVPLALGGLATWCVVLTIYVAKHQKDVDLLWDLPDCSALGLIPKASFNIMA